MKLAFPKKATAEVPPPWVSDSESWARQFADTLNRQRERVQQFLAVQQERLQRTEAQLAQQLEHLAEELAQDHDHTRQAKEEIRQYSDQLTRQIESLSRLRQDCAAREADWEQQQRRAAVQQETLLEQLRCPQEELPRRRAEFEQHAAEEQAALKQELEAAQRREAQLALEVESLRARCDQPGGPHPAEGSPPGSHHDEAGDDYRRRYEAVLGELHELKARELNFQQQLAKARAEGLPPAETAGAILNWEVEKQRILATLEADFEAGDVESAVERSELENLIQTTERALAEKDREIAELKQVLRDQSTNLGTVAVGAAALGEILDTDAVVREERENLKQLQQQWRDKLCQAEIEISIERATIARERAQLEEKLLRLENRSGRSDEQADESPRPDKPIRGRWLTRLGLKESDAEQRP